MLKSLDSLKLGGHSAVLEIWIDRNTTGGIDAKTVSTAKSFHWARGPTSVHVQPVHAGLYGQWIDTWTPPSDATREMALFLEDDLVVSPYAYRWLRAVFAAFGNRTDFAGASLNEQVGLADRLRRGTVTGPKTDTAFMFRALGSWGFAPHAATWRRFQVS
jgi:hypothetical protein